jgi:uncharacterized protein HemX
MANQSRDERPPGPDHQSRRERIFVLALLVLGLVVTLGVYESIPAKEHHATAPDPTARTVRDLQTSLQQAMDQLKALQQTVSSGQAETKRLSDQVNALVGKLDALQQTFASAQQASPASPSPPALPTEPARPKRWAR